MTDPPESIAAPSARRFAGNATILAGGELAARVISFAGTLAVANLLGPTAFGATALTQTLMLYFAMLSDGGLTLYSQRQLVLHRDRAADLVADTLATQLVLATLAAAVLAAIAVLQPFQHTEAVLLLLAIPFMYSQAFSTVYVLRGLERVRAAAAASVLTQVIASGVAIVMVAVTHRAGWAIAAMWAGELVSDVFALVLVRRLVPLGHLPRRTLRAIGPRSWTLLRAGAPLLLAAALFQYATLASNVSLGLLRDTREVGIYGAAVRPLVLMPMLVAVASYALIPEIVRRLAIGVGAAARFTADVVAVVVRVGLVVAVLGYALAPHLVRAVYGPAFAPAGTVLRIAVWMLPVFAYIGLVSATLAAHGRNRHLLAAQGVAAVLATVVLPIGSAAGGARGTATALLVVLLALAVTLGVVARGYLGWQVPRAALLEVAWTVPLAAATAAAVHGGLAAAPVVGCWLAVALVVELVRRRPTVRALATLRRDAATSPAGARQAAPAVRTASAVQAAEAAAPDLGGLPPGVA